MAVSHNSITQVPNTRLSRRLTVFACFLLAACQYQVKEEPPIVVKSELSPQVVSPEPWPLMQARSNVSALEQQLLDQAQEAFRQGRYTTPDHDNAYDKFKSVLLVNPDNAQARSGLQAIMLKYAELVRQAITDDRIRAAHRYLRTAESHFPENMLLKDLRDSLDKKKHALMLAEDSDWVKDAGVEELRLSAADLNNKSESVISMLTDLALRLKDSDESVLIYARSDKEGRWIYKQLKNAASGYRVRGDIRISRYPKVKILPPL